MKKIVIPFEFSEVSVNALKYALKKFKHDAIDLVHVSIGLFGKDQTLALNPIKTSERVLTEELGSMIMNELELKAFPANVEIKILDGDIVDSIHKYVIKEKVDLVVMGSRDKYDLLDRWIGTVSLGLVKLLDVPVYLIPRYSVYNGYEKALVASDFHLKETSVIQAIKDWNKKHKAYIKFMHIQQNDDDDFGEESDIIVNSLFEKSDPDFGFEISRIKSLHVSDSLLATAYNYHADILILIPEAQDFISALLFKSITKEMILKSNIPILFLH